MYLVGFYSPKAKSGVTELSLAIYQWLKINTHLSVGFISYGTLAKEKISEELLHEFSKFSFAEQKRKMKIMKKQYDIIIYDASSRLSDGVIKLLPYVDRLFVVGEEHSDLAEKLHQIIEFNKKFDKSVKSFISQLQGNKTFIIRENKGEKIMGFNPSKKDTNDIAQIVYTDYVTNYLEQNFIKINEKLSNRIKKIPKEDLFQGVYELGVNFEVAMIFHKYVLLREAIGQMTKP